MSPELLPASSQWPMSPSKWKTSARSPKRLKRSRAGVDSGRSADQMRRFTSSIVTYGLLFVAGSVGLGQASHDARPKSSLPPCSEDVAKVRVQTTVMGVQSKAFLTGLTPD